MNSVLSFGSSLRLDAGVPCSYQLSMLLRTRSFVVQCAVLTMIILCIPASNVAFAGKRACDEDQDCGATEACSKAGACCERAEPLPLLFGSKRSAPSSTPVTYFGLDYSLARFIGADDFNEESQVVDYYPGVWNRLWVKERMEDMDRAIGPVSQEIQVVEPNNSKLTIKQVDHRDGGDSNVTTSHITEAKLASLVKGYRWSGTEGLGLVLVVDRLVKLQAVGCSWIVYFDLDTRKIEASSRECAEAGGFGFRNYWFRTAKDLLPRIKSLKP